MDSNYLKGQERNQGKRILTPTYWSWDEFISQCEQPPHPKNSFGGRYCDSTRECLAEILPLARDGWPEGRARMLKFRGMLDNVIAGGGFKHEHVFSEAGDEVDVGRFLTGEPENMVQYIPREYKGGKGGRIVKLLINVTSSASIGSDKAYLRGALALAFCDILEQYGYRVELWVGEIGTGEEVNIFIRTRFKAANEHFDINRLATAVCHPKVQHGMFFSIYEQHHRNQWPGRNHGGGGTFDDPDPEVIEFGYLWHVDQGGNMTADNIHGHFNLICKKFGLEMSELT